jgi:lipoate-protein ligase A
MYSLVLSYELRPRLRAVDQAHRFVLGVLAGALERLVPGVSCRGTSDLALGERKLSGNSIRCKRTHLLYHGTLLYDFPLGLIDRCLAMPPRQPAYRGRRGHGSFVTNLPLAATTIRQALTAAWQADEPRRDWPRELTASFVAEHYGRPDWNADR